MAKILHFPTELVRDWTEWETTIREILDEAKASPGNDFASSSRR